MNMETFMKGTKYLYFRNASYNAYKLVIDRRYYHNWTDVFPIEIGDDIHSLTFKNGCWRWHSKEDIRDMSLPDESFEDFIISTGMVKE